MATEVQKSIQISYKADLKDLMEKLKQIPNVTDQEAKKMVAALDRQLKQAENAAKKSAAASKKAAQEAGKAASRGSQQFDDMADSARKAEERLEHVADASGDIDRGFSSIGLALRAVNPQLAEAADGIADAFSVTEGLTMSFKSLNPYVIAGAVAVGALTLGYMSYQQEIEKARQLTLEMKDAQRGLNDSYKELRGNFTDSLTKLGDIQDQYAVLTGSITEYDLALKQTERRTKGMFTSNIEQQQTVIDQRTEELAMVKRIMKGNLDSVTQQALLSETEKERLRNLQLITAGVQKNVDLTAHDHILNNQLVKIRNSLTKEIATQQKAMGIIVGHQEQALDMALQIQEYENATKQAKEAQVGSHEKIVDLNEDEEDNLRNLIELDQKRFKGQQDASNKLQTLTEEQGLSATEIDELKFARELEIMAELGEVSQQQAEAKDLINAKIAEREEENIERLKKLKRDAFNQDMDNMQSLFSSLGEFTNAAMGLMKEKGREDSKAAKILFNMSKAAALGDIAFESAKQIMAATALPPGFRGAKIGLVLATAAAQTGLVMAQQPPQSSFHMGGMAPDEMNSRVLQGEAVLDRATVQRIGGEEGVQQLQQGGGMDSQVVVIQPFRHFGRFAREIGFRPQKQTGIRAY
jgi:chromosome segregation ATPase